MHEELSPLQLGAIWLPFIWLFTYAGIALVDAALKGTPDPPTASEDRRMFLRYLARLLVAWMAIYVFDASPTGLLFWLLTAALGAPGIWWPMMMLKLGALRASALAGFCAGPLLSRVAHQHERTFFVTLAAIHQPNGWLARRADALLTAERREPRGAELAARALLALRDGEIEEARLLFELVAGLSPLLVSRTLRAYCQQFLLADAALRGNWNEVQARCKRGFLTPTAAVFAHAARLRAGPPAARQRLQGAFALLLTPHRSYAWRLCQWARSEGAARAPQPACPPADAALPERLQALATWLQAPPGSWPADGLRPLLDSLRAVTSAEPELDELWLELQVALARHLEESWYTPEDLASLGNVTLHAQMTALDEVERLRDTLRDGCATTEMPSTEHWRLWAKLRARLDAAWRLGADPESTFESVAGELITISAKLWNKRGEGALAHEIARFLDRHRQLAHTSTRRELIQKNHKIMRRP